MHPKYNTDPSELQPNTVGVSFERDDDLERWMESDSSLSLDQYRAWIRGQGKWSEQERLRIEAAKMRPQIAERDGAFCQHCGTTEKLTVDHIVPRSRGGTNDPKNLQLLCRSCNSKKGAK